MQSCEYKKWKKRTEIMLPKTSLGRYSTSLFAAFLLLFLVAQFLVVSGQRGGETFSDNLAMTIPLFMAGSAAIAASIIGFISILKKHERS
jgi:hypothetical protein